MNVQVLQYFKNVLNNLGWRATQRYAAVYTQRVVCVSKYEGIFVLLVEKIDRNIFSFRTQKGIVQICLELNSSSSIQIILMNLVFALQPGLPGTEYNNPVLQIQPLFQKVWDTVQKVNKSNNNKN